ncbi:MAG: response regulator [Chloroflexi bacterium]|nr:response regulator [Chloroflexota bacterium]
MAVQNVRVVLASESPQVRNFLRQLVERENGVEVVGQAKNAVGVLTLVGNLSPDVAVIDCHLPHSISLDTIPLSRISGLDAAQGIRQIMPNTKVILLNNLDKASLLGGSAHPDMGIYTLESGGASIALGPDRLAEETYPLFASLGVKPEAAMQQKVTSAGDKVIFFGALAFAGGWLLTITVAFAPVGAPLALLGGVTVALGLAAKLAVSLWRKAKKGTR